MSLKNVPPSLHPWLILAAVLLLALGSAAISPASPLQHGLLPAAAMAAAPTPKPEVPIEEVSTDLIVLLGCVLLLVILIPLLLHSRDWMGKEEKKEDEG